MGTLQIIYECYQKYYAAGGINVLLLAALLWLYKRKKGEKIMPLVWVSVLMIGIIVFPLTAKVIMLIIGSDVYWRVFWILPAVLVLAYAGVELVWEQRTNSKRVLLALACMGLIAVNGSFVFGKVFFKPKENNFKLPNAVVQLATAIDEHAKTYRIKKKKVVSPTSVAVYIRLYDASVRQRYGRYAMAHESAQPELYRQINMDRPDYESLCRECHRRKWKYVILTEESDNREAMAKWGYECIYETDGYRLYFDVYRYRFKERRKRGIRKRKWPQGHTIELE